MADTITEWGGDDGYFEDDREAETFRDELKHLVVTQKAAFNSPVWFNIGVKGVPQQGSACFILSVDDKMDSILNWYREEGTIFKGGSGAGVNLSRIRASTERLAGGGTASGPVSFMRGADASAGTIKSGGKTRRAAKMVILDVDHPDITDFIWCKALEERKARVLRDAGFDMDLDGTDSFSIQYQNANNSVRVTDEFMQAVVDGSDWALGCPWRRLGAPQRSPPATSSVRSPTPPGSAPTRACNSTPPSTGGTPPPTRAASTGATHAFRLRRVCTPIKVSSRLVTSLDVSTLGKHSPFIRTTKRARGAIQPYELTSPESFMITGYNEIVKLGFDNGMELRCTPGHKLFTTNRGFVEAKDLADDDEVKVLDLYAPAVHADQVLPVAVDPGAYRTKGDHASPLRFPEEWTENFSHYLGWLIGDGSTSGSTTSTIYGSAEDRYEVLPRHQELIEWINGDRSLKVSEQINGTAQLRIASWFQAIPRSTGGSFGERARKVRSMVHLRSS